MATPKTINLFLQKNTASLNIAVPKELKNLIKKRAKREGINPSQFVKLVLIEKLEREEENSTISN
jgi:predicted DNA binding CopG/RHH family protein